MGLISDDEYHDLQIVRKIRNQFAHAFGKPHFSSDEIAKVIRNSKLV
jgi:DNA-binding MltR family transcriptional regulator